MCETSYEVLFKAPRENVSTGNKRETCHKLTRLETSSHAAIGKRAHVADADNLAALSSRKQVLDFGDGRGARLTYVAQRAAVAQVDDVAHAQEAATVCAFVGAVASRIALIVAER